MLVVYAVLSLPWICAATEDLVAVAESGIYANEIEPAAKSHVDSLMAVDRSEAALNNVAPTISYDADSAYVRLERARKLHKDAENITLIRNTYSGSMIPNRGKGLLQVQRLVELALQHSPEIRDAEASWQAAHNDLDEAKGALWPKVDMNGNSAAAKFGKGNPYGNGTYNRVGVTLSYTVSDGGRTIGMISNKEHIEHSAQAKYLLARNKIAFETTNIFLQIAKQQMLIGAYQEYLDRMNLLANNMVEIVKVIPGRRSELTQANTRVMQAEENLFNAQSKKRDNQIELIKLIGEKIKINDIKELDIDIPPLPLDAALKRAEGHPALLAADADASAAKSLVNVSRASQAPQLEVQASKMTGVDVMGYSDPGQVYFSVKWNAFQGFAGAANERAAISRAVSSDEKFRQTINEIEFKLNSAWADFQTQERRIKNFQLLLVGTDQVRQDYYTQWQVLGRRNLLEVLVAESEHLNTVAGLITGKVDKSIAAAKMYFEAGEMADWMIGEN